jgi:HPt (histidine-containing phosphotransfer) domain-containing protein
MKTSYSLPLINESLVDELFGFSDDADVIVMQREIWGGVRESFLKDLEQGVIGNISTVRSALHRIRGYCSSTGAQRVAELMQAWETESDPLAVAAEYLEESKRVSLECFAAIEKRHPHLVAG